LKNLQKVYFKFIPSLLQFIFGLNAFESLILKLKSLFENCEKNFVAHCQFALMALASQLIFFIFHAGQAAARPGWPTSAQASPPRGIISLRSSERPPLLVP
jgi:hypothetical protein